MGALENTASHKVTIVHTHVYMHIYAYMFMWISLYIHKPGRDKVNVAFCIIMQ